MSLQLPRFEDARVLVVGDLMLDRYWHGGTHRISPEAPVPIVRVEASEERPGGAGNVALNIAALGAGVRLLAVSGRDEAAATVLAQLEQAGIECVVDRIASFRTITKLRVLSRHQQLIRLDFEDGFAGYGASSLLSAYRQALPGYHAVVLSDYGKGTLRPVRELIELAREQGKPVLIDPKGERFEPYRGATIVTPNLKEFETIAGPCANDEELANKAATVLRKLELEALLITRGEHGMSLVRGDGPALHLGAEAREVYDVTGAGDTVISTLATALAAGGSMAEATALANVAAGIVVGKLGTAAVTVAELRRALHEPRSSARILRDAQQLREVVADARAHGETIVMTNGCFDLVHAGHIEYLGEARRLGDRLIVAVNDDASVRRLKGAGRPVNPLSTRATVLSALRAVDWVVPFAEDTPEGLICGVNPDVLVKGGDYRPEQIAGHDCVRAHGGQVVVLGYREGHSTTELIRRIQTPPD